MTHRISFHEEADLRETPWVCLDCKQTGHFFFSALDHVTTPFIVASQITDIPVIAPVPEKKVSTFTRIFGSSIAIGLILTVLGLVVLLVKTVWTAVLG